jgi:hypothetical protein
MYIWGQCPNGSWHCPRSYLNILWPFADLRLELCHIIRHLYLEKFLGSIQLHRLLCSSRSCWINHHTWLWTNRGFKIEISLLRHHRQPSLLIQCTLVLTYLMVKCQLSTIKCWHFIVNLRRNFMHLCVRSNFIFWCSTSTLFHPDFSIQCYDKNEPHYKMTVFL